MNHVPDKASSASRWLRRMRDLGKRAGFFLTNRDAFRVISRVRRERLTYLDVSALIDLYNSVAQVVRNGRRGILIEAGCALGGSAIVIAAAKEPTRPLYIYDVFDTIPPPSPKDGPDAHERYAEIAAGRSVGIRGASYYGYEEHLFGRVKDNFARLGYPVSQNNVHLVKGLFAETLIVTEPVACAHLDCDWYDSVWTCLERIEPHLIPGGELIVDDYDTWSGCRSAVDEYFRDKKDHFAFVFKSRLHIVRL